MSRPVAEPRPMMAVNGKRVLAQFTLTTHTIDREAVDRQRFLLGRNWVANTEGVQIMLHGPANVFPGCQNEEKKGDCNLSCTS